MTTMTADKVPPRVFISADPFGRVTARISQEECIDLRLAERIADQALGSKGPVRPRMGQHWR